MREMRLAGRIGGGGAMGVVFFLILVSIMPFAVGPDLALLARIGPAILWIAALTPGQPLSWWRAEVITP